MQQEKFEIQEILDSLRERKILGSARVTQCGACNCWTDWDDITGREQGGYNDFPVESLVLIEDNSYNNTETWLVQWGRGLVGSALLLIQK